MSGDYNHTVLGFKSQTQFHIHHHIFTCMCSHVLLHISTRLESFRTSIEITLVGAFVGVDAVVRLQTVTRGERFTTTLPHAHKWSLTAVLSLVNLDVL